MAPLITLTTDFGTRDAYVAELKAVLFSEGPPDLRVVDLSHELAPFDVHAAALFVRAALPRFPQGTIHVAVVDPGVGSDRAALIVRLRGMTLIGPDNCLFSYLFDGTEEVFLLDREKLGGREVSNTFHGRDVFAPAAARIAAGARAEEFGPRAGSYKRMAFPMVEVSGDALHGRIIHIDHYGNLITNISAATLKGFLGGDASTRLSIAIGEQHVRSWVDFYAQGEAGQLVALIGSSGLLEVAAREASAQRKLNVEVGRAIRVQRGS
jgi:S-adenosyl-L-methionine hydrolase (adenosine-forming)